MDRGAFTRKVLKVLMVRKLLTDHAIVPSVLVVLPAAVIEERNHLRERLFIQVKNCRQTRIEGDAGLI